MDSGSKLFTKRIIRLLCATFKYSSFVAFGEQSRPWFSAAPKNWKDYLYFSIAIDSRSQFICQNYFRDNSGLPYFLFRLASNLLQSALEDSRLREMAFTLH